MDVNREYIINKLYQTNFVQNYAFQLCSDDDKKEFDDIVQELWLIICEIKEERLIQLYDQGGINQIRKYTAGIISRQIRSDTSTIHKKYREYNNKFIASEITDATKKKEVDIY